jgi:HEAT repeat protein
VLEPLLHDRYRAVRLATVKSLDKLGWKPIDTESMIAYTIAAEQWEKSVTFGDAALLPLQAALLDDAREVRQGAVAALVQIGHEPAELTELREQLRHPQREIRQAAVQGLDQLGWRPLDIESTIAYTVAAERWEECVTLGAAAIPVLESALRDEAYEVRQGAALAMDRLDWQPSDIASRVFFAVAADRLQECINLGEQAVPALIILLQHRAREIRRVVAGILGEICSPTATVALCQALRDTAWEVRRAAARSLGWIGESTALHYLCEALQDSVWSVREASAEALGQLGIRESCDPLVSALHDEDWRVRRAASSCCVFTLSD